MTKEQTQKHYEARLADYFKQKQTAQGERNAGTQQTNR